MSWMVPRNKLDPDQNRFLDEIATTGKQDNCWISGFAGSGKSVLIVAALQQILTDDPSKTACVVLYTHSLIDLIRTGIPDDMKDVPVVTYYDFRKSSGQYDVILADEVQDLPASVLASMRERSSQLIVAGDDAQSIYDKRVDPSKITEVADAKQFPLTILHRLPRNVVRLAKEIFPEKNLSNAKEVRLESVQPRIGSSETLDDEVEYVWTKACQYASPDAPAVILLPSHGNIVSFANDILRLEGQPHWGVEKNQYGDNDYRKMNHHLHAHGLQLRYLGNRYGSLKEAESEERVFLMTYHSVKGLDFEAVFIPRLTEGLSIWRDDPEREKTLFYVAFTRSRRDLYLTYTGSPHRFLKQIPEGPVHHLTIPEPDVQQQSSGDDIDFVF